MNMAEALEWAAKYAAEHKLFEPVRNERGFADGWTPPSPAEKATILKNLALQVVDPVPLIESLAMKCDHGYVICARCDVVPPSWRSFPLTT